MTGEELYKSFYEEMAKHNYHVFDWDNLPELDVKVWNALAERVQWA